MAMGYINQSSFILKGRRSLLYKTYCKQTKLCHNEHMETQGNRMNGVLSDGIHTIFPCSVHIMEIE